MAAVVQVRGAKKMRKELKAAGLDLKDLREPHASASRTVALAARPDTPRLTGRLASTVRSSGTRTAGIIRAGNSVAVPYAGPIHWGWPARNIKAQPWIYDAAERTQPQWLKDFEAEMNDALGRVRGLG
jgi:hypothetical protein